MIPRKVLMAAAVSGVVTFIFCQIGLYDVLNIKRVPASEVYRSGQLSAASVSHTILSGIFTGRTSS